MRFHILICNLLLRFQTTCYPAPGGEAQDFMMCLDYYYYSKECSLKVLLYIVSTQWAKKLRSLLTDLIKLSHFIIISFKAVCQESISLSAYIIVFNFRVMSVEITFKHLNYSNYSLYLLVIAYLVASDSDYLKSESYLNLKLGVT